MEKNSSQNYDNIIKKQGDRLLFYPERSSVENIGDNHFSGSDSTAISENFSYYLRWLGLARDPNLIFLSSSNHYYYEAEDLKNVRALINLKQFNHMNQVREFLDNIYSILPSKSYLIGCFSDNEEQSRFLSDSYKPDRKIAGQFDPTENGIASRNPFLNMVYNILDIKTNRYCTKKTVTRELETAGWRVEDMTEIKGLTFFCAKKNILN